MNNGVFEPNLGVRIDPHVKEFCKDFGSRLSALPPQLASNDILSEERHMAKVAATPPLPLPPSITLDRMIGRFDRFFLECFSMGDV